VSLTRRQLTDIDALLDEMLDLPEHQRLAALHRRGIDDPAVRAEVDSLLRAAQASAAFLSKPARPQVARPQVAQVDPDAAVDKRIGAWRIVRLLGRGGMGDVYEAVRADGNFEQRAAIKLLQREAVAQLQRFQAERQILATLDHPGIARLYDGGVSEDDRPYMVMEYVEGRPITEYCALIGANVEQRLDLFKQVCAAVAFAHRSRIVHRDLKPSNILVTADGTVKLLDFGIAKFLDAQAARLTHAAGAPMTPVCAAPEQLTGQPITGATDVYALGLLLFELLTGTHPWMGADTPMLQAMRTVLERPAPLASRAAAANEFRPVPARSLRGDLDAVIAKALRKEPQLRYATATALEADVSRVLRGLPVHARDGVRLYVVGRSLRRHRWVIAGIAAMLICAAAGVQAARWQAQHARRAAAGYSLALVGFRDLQHKESDAWVAAALTEMLATELSSGERVQVVEDELVRDALKGMTPDSAGGYASDALARLGERVGADYVLSGSYLLTPGPDIAMLRIDLTLRDAHTGRRVAAFAQQAGLQDLTPLVKDAGASIRDKLGIQPKGAEALTGIANAQPPSVDVARLLAQAHDDMEHYQAARAKDELLQAIAEAPAYAPAYLDLSEAWSALGFRQKATAAAEQAASRAESLPPQMRLQVDAVLQAAKYQWNKADDDWRKLILLRPAVVEYRLRHIEVLLAAGATSDAQAALKALRALTKDKSDPRVELAAAHVDAALSDPKAAAADARKALEFATLDETPGLIADAQLALAQAQSRLGQAADTEAAARAAIDAYRASGNPRGEAEARRELARQLAEDNQVQLGREESQRALSIFQSIGDIGGVANIYRDVCESLWVMGERDGAQAAARQGLRISREIGDLKLQAWMLQALANIGSDEAASDEVVRDFREVIEVAARSGDPGGHVWALATYADTARLRGEMLQARNACSQATAEAEPLSDPQFAIYSGFVCAEVKLDGGEPTAAQAMLLDVIDRSKSSGNSIYLANAQMTLAELDLEASGCAHSQDVLQSAIDTFAAGEKRTGEAEAVAVQALCQQAAGDIAGRDKSIARARVLRDGINSRQEVFFVDITLARIGFAKGAHNDAIARLNAMAADAAARHWLTWALEAKLAAWQLAASSGEKAMAAKLRRELERSAREHGLVRILTRLQQLSRQV
jgi:serine/threonine protein kinase/TolB-like protein